MARDIGARAGDVICFGHTHKPWQRVVGGIQFINTGSVGRPKDGDWRACYALLSVEATGAHVEFVRVPYNVDEATDELFLGSAGCWAPASWTAAYDTTGTVRWDIFQAGIPALRRFLVAVTAAAGV